MKKMKANVSATYFNLLQKFWINNSIYGTEEGPHMWPKHLPSFLAFFIYNIDNY